MTPTIQDIIGKGISYDMHKDGDWGLDGETAWRERPDEFRKMAQAALIALEQAGYVVVPREPAQRIVEAYLATIKAKDK